MEVKYLPISIDNINSQPDKFNIKLGGAEYIFEVSWNPVAEAFFFDLFDSEKNPIIYGRRIVYAQDMLENIPDDGVPEVQIVPMDPSGEADQEGITFENFMNSVKPYIVGDD